MVQVKIKAGCERSELNTGVESPIGSFILKWARLSHCDIGWTSPEKRRRDERCPDTSNQGKWNGALLTWKPLERHAHNLVFSAIVRIAHVMKCVENHGKDNNDSKSHWTPPPFNFSRRG